MLKQRLRRRTTQPYGRSVTSQIPVFNFDGTNDYIACPADIRTTTDIQVTGNFKTTSSGIVFLVDQRVSSSSGFIIFMFTGGTVKARVNTTGSDVETVGTYNDGAWHSFNMVYDGVNLSLTVDAETVSVARTGSNVGSATLSIGQGNIAGGSNFPGGMYDIKIYKDGSQVVRYDGSYGAYDTSGNDNHGTPTNIDPLTFYSVK